MHVQTGIRRQYDFTVFRYRVLLVVRIALVWRTILVCVCPNGFHYFRIARNCLPLKEAKRGYIDVYVLIIERSKLFLSENQDSIRHDSDLLVLELKHYMNAA